MDVASLYTNIDIDAGLAAVEKVFHKYPDPTRPDKELLELSDINLRRNDFVFDGQFYLQVKGMERDLHRLMPIFLWQTGNMKQFLNVRKNLCITFGSWMISGEFGMVQLWNLTVL